MKTRSVGWRLTVLTLLAAAAIGALCALLYGREAEGIEARWREREALRTALLARLLRSSLQPAVDDLQLLVDGDGLQSFLVTGTDADLARAVRRAAFISRLRKDYDQVRYLDETGREVLRVNQGGVPVAREALQDKADRPYFKKTAGLAAGQIYLSALDLNVEHGRVEQPLKPVLRLATPVFDAAGRRRGVYVVNVLGRRLMQQLADTVPAYAHRLRLLDAHGYWLIAGDPAQEWGFQLPGREGATLARSDGTLWTRVSGEAQGQVRHAGGLFTWLEVPLRELSDDPRVPIVPDQEFLVVASEMSAAEFSALFVELRGRFLLLASALVLLVATSAWFFDGRRRALVSLRESEESLAVTLHSIGDAVLATDTDGRVTRMNRVAEQLTGWSESEARGRPIAEVFRIVDDVTREPAHVPVADVLATGQTKGLASHTALVARDGSERLIADSAAPIRDRRGALVGVVLVWRDITESRRAEAERDRFFDLSLDFLCISSADGYFKRASPGVTDMLGWSVEEFLATPYIDLVHPDDRPKTLAEVEKQLRDGQKVLHFENRYRHKDGSWRVLSWRSVPQGQLMYAIARDVTERKDMEERLRGANDELERRVLERTAELERAYESLQRSERRFRALIEHGADGISVIDKDNNILYLSPAVTAVEGYTAEELAGRNGLENTHPDDLPLIQEAVARLLAHPGQPIPALWRRRHKDGRWLWLEGVATNLIDDPAVNGIVTNYRDVTERKRAEEQIHQLNLGLERRVLERTTQLEAANKELESFSYSVSHDLRAPLRHVQGFVEMLTEELGGGLSAKAVRYLKTISAAAQEMGQLIDDLLSFSKMGRAEMREASVDLGALVAKIRRDLEPTIGARRVEWDLGRLPRVHGDPAMLRQVFANLLDNAVKYTRQRDPARIEVGTAGLEGERLVFYVRDNGAGFEMKYADKLFGVFQRLHRADEFEGTGIGLANVRRIVSRHGGRTWAEASLGQGATFYFTLAPAAEETRGNP